MKRHGFTLIELMVVILIVAILAAVLAPMMTGRVQEAKWTEGKTGAGTIATALRAYCAEQGVVQATAPTPAAIGILAADLTGKYFLPGNYTINGLTYDPTTGAITYSITVTAPAAVGGGPYTLDQTGTWTVGATP